MCVKPKMLHSKSSIILSMELDLSRDMPGINYIHLFSCGQLKSVSVFVIRINEETAWEGSFDISWVLWAISISSFVLFYVPMLNNSSFSCYWIFM